jgi:hypothetical protein
MRQNGEDEFDLVSTVGTEAVQDMRKDDRCLWGTTLACLDGVLGLRDSGLRNRNE